MSSSLKCDGATSILNKHSTAQMALEEFGEDFFSFFSFSVIRNPWDQVVSFYEHLRKPLYISETVLRRQYPDFDGILNPKIGGKLAMESCFSSWCKAIYRDRVDKDYIFNDLTYFTHGNDGKLLLSYVGRFERLREDFDHIVACAGISVHGIFRRQRMPKLNRSRRGGYREYYSTYTRDLIGDAFCDTVEKFGYEFKYTNSN